MLSCQLIRKGAIQEGYLVCTQEATEKEGALEMCKECSEVFEHWPPSMKVDALVRWLKYKNSQKVQENP